MTFFGREDKFDEVRRAWIAHHQGWSTIQRRRAEQLGRRVRARQRDRSSAVPDPHDDTTLPPMWLRTAKSPAAQLELMIVLVAGAVVPLGWLGGVVLKASVVRSIPGTLRGYPIIALLCSGAGLAALCAVLTTVSDPGQSFTQLVVLPWACLQAAFVPVVAGLYGVAEGWLAVPGSRQWWPLTPSRRVLSPQDAADILGGYDLTGPGLIPIQRLAETGERSRT